MTDESRLPLVGGTTCPAAALATHPFLVVLVVPRNCLATRLRMITASGYFVSQGAICVVLLDSRAARQRFIDRFLPP